MTQPNNECRQVYTGRTLDRSIHITSEVGDLVPLVSMQIAIGACSITHSLSPHSAAELGLMLIAASKAAGGSALTGNACATTEAK